ncbi:MAG: sigma 54-interacting transcriptional regulator [Cyanobium sp.]
MDPLPLDAELPQAACVLRLAPFLVGRSRRGVVGTSRYAQALRRAIRQASADPQRQPVLISGEPGLEKDNLAALIHFGSPDRRQLLVRLNCATLRSDGAELFGGSAEGPSLLACLGEGALLLDQIDRADPALQESLRQLVATGRWRDARAGSSTSPAACSSPPKPPCRSWMIFAG